MTSKSVTSLVRIAHAEAVALGKLHLVLTDGRTIERDVTPLLVGPIFDRVRSEAGYFAQVRVEAGTVVWPNGADLCPDVLIWNGPPPAGRA